MNKENSDGVMGAVSGVVLPASLTIDTVEKFTSELANTAFGEEGLEVDAAPLQHMTTPGVQVLLSLHTSVSRAGGKLRLRNFSPEMLQICSSIGLETIAQQWVQPDSQ